MVKQFNSVDEIQQALNKFKGAWEYRPDHYWNMYGEHEWVWTDIHGNAIVYNTITCGFRMIEGPRQVQEEEDLVSVLGSHFPLELKK